MKRLLKIGLVGSVALAGLGCTSTTQPSVTAGNNQGPSATSSSNSSEAPKQASSNGDKPAKPKENASAGTDEQLAEVGMLYESDVSIYPGWTVTAKGKAPYKPEPDAPAACPFIADFYDGAELMSVSQSYSKDDNEIKTTTVVYESESHAKAAMDVRRRDQEEECQRKGLDASFTSQGNEVSKITSEPVEVSGEADEEVWTELNFTVVNEAGVTLRGGTLFAVFRIGRGIVIMNLKNVAGDVGQSMPQFAKDPLIRLRDVQE